MFHDTQPAALDDEGGLDAWAQFRVDDASEVLHLLQLLRDRSAPLGLSSPQGVAVRSQLWSLDPARQHLTFSADGGGPLVQRLAQDDEAVAVGYLDNVKLQFDLLDLVLVHANASCALRARVPGAIYRFQRRAAYRVRSFDRRAPKVLLRHPSLPDMRIGLRIVDLSTGGCALLLPDDVPALQLSGRNRDHTVTIDLLRLVRQQCRQGIQCGGSLCEGAHLKPVTQQHDDHQEREFPPEVQLVGEDPQARAQRGDERDGDRHPDQKHHSGLSGPDLTDSAVQERAAAPDVEHGAEDHGDLKVPTASGDIDAAVSAPLTDIERAVVDLDHRVVAFCGLKHGFDIEGILGISEMAQEIDVRFFDRSEQSGGVALDGIRRKARRVERGR